jgi:hypothetical protein
MNSITTVTQERAIAPRRRRMPRWAVALGALVLLLAVGFGLMLRRMSDVPANLDLATTRPSAQGLYRVSYAPTRGPIAINRIHSWTIHVAAPDGRPITDAVITVDGNMPQHGHGLPTQPQVTQNLGNGSYLVEGMKFQMGGWWVVDFSIDAGGKRDTVRFNLLLQ